MGYLFLLSTVYTAIVTKAGRYRDKDG